MKALKAVLIAILITAIGAGVVQADWETRRVNDDYDDLMITTTGGVFQTSSWIEVVGGQADLFNYYAFRSISLPNNSVIDNAYLEFEAPFPWNYNQSCPVTIYGLKVGDLTSWNPVPSFGGIPKTTSYKNWDAYDLISSHKINVTVTDIVQEIYDQYAWENGSDMGFQIQALAVSGGQRFQVAHDGDSTKALKLYIEYSEGTVGTDYYYKGYKIQNLTAGVLMSFDWVDSTDGNSRVTTMDGTDYETHNISMTLSSSPDNIVSIGAEIYMVHVNETSPFNKSLFVSSDRGLTWTNKGEVSAGAGTLQQQRGNALSYDGAGTIHIGFNEALDNWYRNYTIATETMNGATMIYDGAYFIGEMRAYWSQNTIWFTRYGGDPAGSLQQSSVIRRYNGVWEERTDPYDTAFAGTRIGDITWAQDRMYWFIMDYQAVVSNRRIYCYELQNYSDFTTWIPLGDNGFPEYAPPAGGVNTFEMGTWNNDPVVSVERTVSGDEYIYSYRWNAGPETWDSYLYNMTLTPTAEFHSPKMYYEEDDLMMGLIVEIAGGYSLIYNDFTHFQTPELSPTIVSKATGHTMQYLGGDMFPYSSSGGWNVSIGGVLFNNTCIQNAVTLEDIQACIDAYLNDTDPFDPDPPDSHYPDHESFGRFDIKFYIWIIGQTLIFAPSIAIAWRRFPLIYYTYFAIMIIMGLGLLWSLSGM